MEDTSTEPGWVKENQLAESLGWTLVKDLRRSSDPSMHWCQFEKEFQRVYRKYPEGWLKVDIVQEKDGEYYRNHTMHPTLEEALAS